MNSTQITIIACQGQASAGYIGDQINSQTSISNLYQSTHLQSGDVKEL